MVTLIAPRRVVATATSSATLARGAHTPVDATSGALTMTLPANAAVGVEVSVEKVDGTANTVTVSGSLRGVASSITLTSQYDARTFLSEGTGSWRPVSDHRTAAALSTAFAGKPANAARDLVTGALVAHRGSYLLYPEDTLEGFAMAVATGARAIKLDVQTLADGSLGVMHDQTVDRTTTTTGNANTFTASAWKQFVTIPAGTNFSPVWPNLHPALLTEVLDQIGGKATLLIEPKIGSAGATPLIAEIVRRGLQASTVLTLDANTDATWMTAAQVAGIATMPYYNGSSPGFSPSLATVMARNPTYIGIGYQYTDADISSVVSTAHAAGIKVCSFSMNRRFERDRITALGVDILMVNDHVYLASSNRLATTTNFKVGTPAPGLISSRNPGSGTSYPASFTGTPYRLKIGNAISTEFYSVGSCSPVANPTGTYTITGSFTVDTTDSSTSRHIDILVCAPDDAPYGADQRQSGYAVNILLDGTLRWFRTNAGATVDGVKSVGSFAQISGNQASTALSAGQTVPFVLTVTPTTLSFTRTDTNVTVTSGTDTTYRGAYWAVGKVGSVPGQLAVSFSDLTVA